MSAPAGFQGHLEELFPYSGWHMFWSLFPKTWQARWVAREQLEWYWRHGVPRGTLPVTPDRPLWWIRLPTGEVFLVLNAKGDVEPWRPR